MDPNAARQSGIDLSAIASNAKSRSPCKSLMISSTSDSAVCRDCVVAFRERGLDGSVSCPFRRAARRLLRTLEDCVAHRIVTSEPTHRWESECALFEGMASRLRLRLSEAVRTGARDRPTRSVGVRLHRTYSLVCRTYAAHDGVALLLPTGLGRILDRQSYRAQARPDLRLGRDGTQ
jgi:hypothetical protein